MKENIITQSSQEKTLSAQQINKLRQMLTWQSGTSHQEVYQQVDAVDQGELLNIIKTGSVAERLVAADVLSIVIRHYWVQQSSSDSRFYDKKNDLRLAEFQKISKKLRGSEDNYLLSAVIDSCANLNNSNELSSQQKRLYLNKWKGDIDDYPNLKKTIAEHYNVKKW